MPSLEKILQRPLIIGASVSAGYASVSPGKRLALRFTDEKSIATLAFNGQPGREVLKKVSDKILADRSVIIGVDLFFWDSLAVNPDPSLTALQQFLESARTREIPLLLGEIPGLLPSRQPGLERMNEAIWKAPQLYPLCQVVPSQKLLEQVCTDEFLDYKGRRYSLSELIPDGLHLGNIASEYVADVLQGMLSSLPS